MTMGERIKKVRQGKHLTQQDFSQYIDVKRNTVALYEAGKITPSSAVISLICREFHVNETWLREGTGEMFAQPAGQVEQVTEWVQHIFTHGSDAEKGLVTAMSTFTKEDFDTLARLIRKVWEGQQAFSPAATEPLPQEKPHWMTEEEWGDLQRGRTAQAGSSTEAG